MDILGPKWKFQGFFWLSLTPMMWAGRKRKGRKIHGLEVKWVSKEYKKAIQCKSQGYNNLGTEK